MTNGSASRTGAAGIMPAAEVIVWDPLVRIFHWSLVAAFFTAFVTGDEESLVHEWAGWIVLGLIAFRLVWGFAGSRHARFRDFVSSPATVAAYLRDLFRGRARRYLGHNPAGGAMILLLLATVGLAAVTGALMTTDWGWGSKALEETHEALANIAIVLVGIHIAGVLVSSLLHGENLVRAMITGRKPSGSGEPS